jgi:3-oxoacyl-[acyl-carrier-protein] synthase-3
MTMESFSTPAAAKQVWSDYRSMKVMGTGAALPGPPLSTSELLDRIENRFGLKVRRRGLALADRLGINCRHICRDFDRRFESPRPGESNPDLAARAIRAALQESGLGVDDLAYLIGHTATPASLIPSNISLVADLLGFRGPHMELRQACTGFANALVIAQGLLSAKGAGPIAIVGSETGSVYFDPLRAEQDTGQLVNLVQMGDGAAAIILAPGDSAAGSQISHNFFGQIGAGRAPGLALKAGGSDQPFLDRGVLEFEHDYLGVKRHGPELFACGAAAASSLGVGIDTVDRILPHQANGRLAELAGCYFGIASHRVFVNAVHVGNTGSAAIWLALAELRGELAAEESVLILGAEATKHMFGGFRYVHG